MLKSLDVLIGLTVILLALSMAVTVITQSITTLLNSRGRHLRRGLTDLLQQLDPALTPKLSKAVATTVLTHPLVSGSNTPIAPNPGEGRLTGAVSRVRGLAGGPRLGSIVHREEFTKLLMGLAAGDGTSQMDTAARDALKAALSNNGVKNPDATLKSIRALALQLERSSPEMSNMARQNAAILHAAESDLVAKINSWFDQSMDRTSQRFTASTRAITFAAAFLVAFGLQVDTPALVNRLAADDQLRAALVAEAQTLQPGRETQTDPNEIARHYRAFMAKNGIIRLPSSADWWGSLQEANQLGLLMTALLLSLGAPFWYSALGRLLQLRSVLAAKDDAQRRERQSNDPTPGGTSEPRRPPVSTVAGERGDPK